MADFDRLHPSASSLMGALSSFGISPISGYRDPDYNRRVGGARGSQHMGGRALDYKASDLPDDATRAKFLEAAVKNGAKGIGIYPGGSIHVDTREGDPAFWGPGGSYRGTTIDQAPAWAQPVLSPMFKDGVVPASPPSADPFGVAQAKTAGVLPSQSPQGVLVTPMPQPSPNSPGTPSVMDNPTSTPNPAIDLTKGTAAAPSAPLVDPNSTFGKTLSAFSNDKFTGGIGSMLKGLGMGNSGNAEAIKAATTITPSSIGNDGQTAAIAQGAQGLMAANMAKRKTYGLSLGGMV